MCMWIYLRAANRLVPQQTLQEPSRCQQVRLHKHVATLGFWEAKNSRKLWKTCGIDVARLSSIAFSMTADASSVWLQAVEGSLPSESKYGRDKKSCCLHIWCSINRTSHNAPLFQLLGIRDFGICLLLSPASLGTWQDIGTNRTNFIKILLRRLWRLLASWIIVICSWDLPNQSINH